MNAERMKFVLNRQRGADTTFKSWDELDPAQQRLLLEDVELAPDEVPAIGCVEGRTRVMITTERIIWQSSEVLQSLELKFIARVSVPEFFESSKHDVHRLWLMTHEGETHVLDVEPGESFFVLWNLLLALIPPAKSRPRAAH